MTKDPTNLIGKYGEISIQGKNINVTIYSSELAQELCLLSNVDYIFPVNQLENWVKLLNVTNTKNNRISMGEWR